MIRSEEESWRDHITISRACLDCAKWLNTPGAPNTLHICYRTMSHFKTEIYRVEQNQQRNHKYLDHRLVEGKKRSSPSLRTKRFTLPLATASCLEHSSRCSRFYHIQNRMFQDWERKDSTKRRARDLRIHKHQISYHYEKRTGNDRSRKKHDQK